MVLATITRFSKRIPLIKFRKGEPATVTGGGSSAIYGTANSTPQQQSTVNYSASAIEDWELPSRYQRKPISFDEMEYINRGGPA